MRSIWKGHIRFSLVTIPVRIYNAIETSEALQFNQLHKECNGRVGHEKKCKKCGKAVVQDEIVKGYQYEPDQYVVMEPGDLEKVKLKSTKVIEIEGFVHAAEIPQAWYESPYFAGPDGDVAAGTYVLLSQALRESKKVGIGKVVLRDREDVVLIAPEGSGIILYKLRYPEEVRSMANVPQADKLPLVNSEQLKLASQLVESMSKDLSQIELKDKYSGALREIIDAKVQGREIITVAEEEIPVVDILTALKESIAQAKQGSGGMVAAQGDKASSPAGTGKKSPKHEAKGSTHKVVKPKAKRKAG